MKPNNLKIHSNKFSRVLLIIAGWFFVGLGIIGIFLPLMPTTTFLVLAAACFARSSEKFYFWLLNNKYLGKFVKDYLEHRAMPLRAKIIAITMVVLTIGYSAIFAVELLWVKILLFVIAVGVISYIISLKTLRKENMKEDFQES